MNDIKDAVFNHLKMDSGGALLITGHWGAGKTYYIKNTLFDKIKGSKDFDYKPIMVSLYGENDASKISTKIIQSLISTGIISAKKITKGITGISKVLPFLSNYVDIEELINLIGGGVFEVLKKNNIVLFFDDLERLGKDLSTNDFLGYVNDLTENHKCKVVIVANAGEIKDEFSYKEKTISKTVVFSMETEDAFTSLKNTYDTTSNFFIFLNDNQDFFLETLIPKVTNAESELSEKFKAEIKKDFVNIRSLKAALEHFKVVFNCIENLNEISNEIFKQKIKNLWCFCLAVTIEARKPDGLMFNTTKGIDNASQFYLGLLFNEKDERKDEDLTFSEIFKKKYYERIGETYYYYPTVYGFLTAGKSLNRVLLNDQLNKNFKSEDNKVSPQYAVYQNFMSLKRSQFKDDEFTKKLDLLLKYTDAGYYKEYNEYVSIATFLFEFKDYFEHPLDIEEIDQKIRNGITKFSQNREFRFQWEIHKEQIADEVTDVNVLSIIQFIDGLVVEKKKAQLSIEASQWEAMLLRSPKEFVIETIEKSYQGILTKNDPVFSYFNPQSIINKITKWQAEDILMFSTILEKRYLRRYIDPLRNEFENVLQIVDFIIGYDLTEKKYSNYYIEKTLLPTARQVRLKIDTTIQNTQ